MRGDGRVFRQGKRWWIAFSAPSGGKATEVREAALAKADAYLSSQPMERNIEDGQFTDSGTSEAAQALTGQRGGWLLR